MAKMIRMTLIVATLALGIIVTGEARGEPEISPEQVIRETSELTMKAIKARREELKDNRQALFELIDEVLLPRWDRQYTGQLIMGPYWREASPEQREAFITGLYRKLIASYGDRALEYDSEQFRVLGTRGNPAEGRIMVDSEVQLHDRTQVPVSYRMRIHEGRWKVYDVVIEGISYVTNYRTQYTSEFRAKGIDGVLTDLAPYLDN